MDLADFDYDLPPDRIAQTPVEPRDSARLLVDRGSAHEPEHRVVAGLADYFGAGDVVVVNHTRVLPARLAMRKPTGGAVEVLLLEPVDDGWEALVRPSRKVAPGTVLLLASGEPDLRVEVGIDRGEGRRHVRLRSDGLLTPEDAIAVLERVGQVPLPPYIHQALTDPDRYQTVFAERTESVAAPTAGLHLTADLLARIEATGARIHHLDLAVGLGTFRPITAERVEDHEMHAERFEVPDQTWEACQDARRVIAVGTTVTRALESAATLKRLQGHTDLFIRRGYDWKVVDLMLTNFHVPRSSLLVMIDAFIGPRWKSIYRAALDEGYRFLSFGDTMLLDRHAP